jgi:hypothetical protein
MIRKAKKPAKDAQSVQTRTTRRKTAAEHYHYFFEETTPIERFQLLPGVSSKRLLKFK